MIIMIRMKNRKGILAYNITMFIVKLIFLMFVLFSVVFIIRSHIKTEFNVFDARADLFFQRIIYGRNVISYIDENTGRSFPGIVDLEKFRNENIDDILQQSLFYGEENRQVGAKLTLTDFDGNIDEEIKYNEEFFTEKEVLVRAGWPAGRGGVKSKDYHLYVLIKDGDKLTEGKLDTIIIIQNR